jgi:hypothetical protein
MDADTDSKLDTVVLLQTSTKVSHGIENTEPSTDGSVGIVFMCLGITEIHQQPVTKILSNVPIKTSDDLSTDPLVCLNDFPEVLRVELGGQGRRFDDVDKHHCELSTLRFGYTRGP